MRKFLVVSIPIATIAVFMIIMLSGSILKRPLGNDDNFQGSVDAVMQDVLEEDWERADKDAEKLNEVWKKILRRVQFSAERDEINALSASLARLEGAILAEDKASAVIELCASLEHWEGLGR
ncbi:DUF4363 family protein [Clostridium polynesiense]|uniref:DUF4363 family protein n=1 Tax=Clostridium polynesiense TaxID=1325933 RepID=UPI0005906011|nr:DUF4363 family protein [Clostridium polynesiense]